ncbi:MAG: TatD family hydrolase [Bdellovibrionota bacterium]
MLEWIDTHTHLEHEYPFSTDEYLANARAQGVTRFVTIGTRPESLDTLRGYAEKYPDVYFTVGIHPHEAKDLNPSVEKKMGELHKHPKCVGVGEIGLDYYYDHSPREIQRAALRRQLDLALDWKKPVVIHARDAETELLEELTRYAEKCTLAQRAGVIHCFSGTKNFAQACLALGFYISFSGIVTFKKADELRSVAQEVPLERILLETDSPFLAPVPYRGKLNQSAYLIETAKIIATLKGVSLTMLSSATVANSRHIFSLT